MELHVADTLPPRPKRHPARAGLDSAAAEPLRGRDDARRYARGAARLAGQGRLDHVADREGRDVDPQALSDDELREIVKLARWRELLPRD